MSAEDLVLMLNMGWSLQDIAQMAELPVRTVEKLIVTQVQRERELISKSTASSEATPAKPI
jgi:hypothetical protein